MFVASEHYQLLIVNKKQERPPTGGTVRNTASLIDDNGPKLNRFSRPMSTMS